MFVDRIRIFAQAGKGGRGCVSFRREKFVPKGGPDGGDGGKGGDIILQADKNTDNLTALFYEPIVKAKSGVHGQGKKKHGRSAVAKVVKVPVGTIVYEAAAPVRRDEWEEEKVEAGEEKAPVLPPVLGEPVADLARDGEEFVLCRGGAGGKGNVHFKSSRNRAPIQYTEGADGEEGHFLFELRTIADVGLVGYPNAGKSTLLTRLSAAHPKIAPYPFTTLHPAVGVVEMGEYARITVADIPGLIEGAHRNLGLGHDFLRHITRCRVLLFVLDTAGSEGRHPAEDLQTLRRELDLYDARLSRRPWFVAANKMDLPGAIEHLEALRQRFPGVNMVPISAEKRAGLDELKEQLARMLPSEPAADAPKEEGADMVEAENIR